MPPILLVPISSALNFERRRRVIHESSIVSETPKVRHTLQIKVVFVVTFFGEGLLSLSHYCPLHRDRVSKWIILGKGISAFEKRLSRRSLYWLTALV